MFPQTAFQCRAVVGERTDFGRYPLDLCDSVKASVRFQVNFGEGFLQRRTIFSPITYTENASLLGLVQHQQDWVQSDLEFYWVPEG